MKLDTSGAYGKSALAAVNWAKLAPRDAPQHWHPLSDHSHDVAACAGALLDLPLIARRIARLAGRDALPTVWRDRLVVLAFLHDFGKANHAFQDRQGSHIAEALPLLMIPELNEAAGLNAFDGWFATVDAANDAWATVLAHHGTPPPSDRGSAGTKHEGQWQATAVREPLRIVRDLVDEARRCWPRAFADGGEVLPQTPSFWHGFLGLLQLGDWLGSDASADAFPFTQESDPPRFSTAPARAAELLAKIGLDVASVRQAMAPATFAAIAGGQFPARPIQAAAAEAEGPVVVLESETGSGKTEGALLRFARLFAAGHVDGLYFALPTRLAATQMVGRVQAAVDRIFPRPDCRPLVVRAVPGDAGADGHTARRLPDFAVQWDDDPDPLAQRRRWAAEGPKRFLAAPIAVGTIDQALLGAVRVKHAQLRSFCLARSLLVVDEVHASDAYMATLLGALLDQHRRAGGETLLLSATLGEEARTRLLLGRSLPRRLAGSEALEAAAAVPYPAISTVRDGTVVTTGHASTAPVKAVEMVPGEAISDPVALAAQALDAARAGARVLVIRNTVGDAVATRQALAQLAPDAPEPFRLGGVGTLHHGRFAREDRRRLDTAVEAALGKDAPRAGGLVLIGTQTLEISLDLDADLLITDLCPIDVLLQRIGRLHRHERARPAGFGTPRCVVLVPTDFEAALRGGSGGGPHGHGTVYEDLLMLEATRRLIGEGAEWILPEMNRQLVEQATHPAAIDALAAALTADDPRWTEAGLRREGKVRAESGTARRSAVDWDARVWDFLLDEAAATRLGARSVELHFTTEPIGAFGEPVSRLVVPHHLNPTAAFEPDALAATPNGFTFRLGDRNFIYDQYGLRREETQPGRPSPASAGKPLPWGRHRLQEQVYPRRSGAKA